jgi:hypothetical protein
VLEPRPESADRRPSFATTLLTVLTPVVPMIGYALADSRAG